MIVAAIAVAPASANAAILVDQLPQSSFQSVLVPSFDVPGPSTSDNQAADDFTVPAGQVWNVQAIDALGYDKAGTGTDTGNVTIYPSNGASPGTQMFQQAGITLGGGTCSVNSQCDISAPISGAPNLPPGNYWISLQSSGQFAWWWFVYPPGGPAFGNPAVWQNPGNASGRNCVTYTPLLQCQWTTATDGKDLTFRLEGSVIDSHFNLGKAKLKSRYVINQPATFLGPGTAVVKDAAAGRLARATISKKKKYVKKVTKAIGTAGTFNLPIKLTNAAKKKVNKGKKVKLRALITFTATGGVPFQGTSTITLVPHRGARPALRIAG